MSKETKPMQAIQRTVRVLDKISRILKLVDKRLTLLEWQIGRLERRRRRTTGDAKGDDR